MFRRHTLTSNFKVRTSKFTVPTAFAAPCAASASRPRFPGGYRSRVTPVPIPNTEVKPATADGTVWVTAWESRSLPGLFSTARWS